MNGKNLPTLKTCIPGPRSSQLAKELQDFECQGITYVDSSFPIFWDSALGANVQDVDGNLFVDATSAFGVASLGHRNPGAQEAAFKQMEQMVHGMGDVHPSEAKVHLARLLSEVTPENLGHVIFSSSGSEAVESAIKSATLATEKTHFLAFQNGYHGLTYGALALTHRPDFRKPFKKQLGIIVHHVPFPDPYRPPVSSSSESCSSFCLEQIEQRLKFDKEIAGIFVEPIQGRGGQVIPPDDFLPELINLAHDHHVLLIADEIYTGFCRTGRWFGVCHSGIEPDLMCVGKGMSNGFPISACLGKPEVMNAWEVSSGEAIHTSTFLGHPVGCAMAVASIQEMQKHRLDTLALQKGKRFLELLAPLKEQYSMIGDIRGCGMIMGIEIVSNKQTKEPDPKTTWRIVQEALKKGVILLSGGQRKNVLSLSPPITITDEQIEWIVRTIELCLSEIE